jgi:hypothetical protein
MFSLAILHPPITKKRADVHLNPWFQRGRMAQEFVATGDFPKKYRIREYDRLRTNFLWRQRLTSSAAMKSGIQVTARIRE